jgi:hypothetical protein
MKINEKQDHPEDKDKDLMKGKAHVHYVVSHYNIGVTKDMSNTSLNS